MPKKAFIVLIFFFNSLNVLGQFETSIGLQFNYHSPESDFQQNVTRNPIGGLISLAINKPNCTWQYGLELGIGLYSGKKYFYETKDEGFPGNFERLYEENGFFSYHLFIRHYLLFNRMIDIYVEGKAGVSTYFSAIRTMQVSEEFEDRFIFHDTALNAGTGIGSQLNIGRLIGKTNWKRKLFFDISAVYLLGSNVKYRNSVKDELVDSFSSGYRQSSTKMLQVRSGFILRF